MCVCVCVCVCVRNTAFVASYGNAGLGQHRVGGACPTLPGSVCVCVCVCVCLLQPYLTAELMAANIWSALLFVGETTRHMQNTTCFQHDAWSR